MYKKPLLRSEAIILSSSPYGDSDAIVNVLTKGRGLLPLFVQNGRKVKSKIYLEPLSHVELVYNESTGHFFKGKETTAINLFLELRENYDTLMAAFDMAEAILTSQLPEKAAPPLFDLLLFYLARLGAAKNPWTLSLSFRLKTLLFEGVLKISPFCNLCQESLEESYLQESLLVCTKCHLGSSLYFNEEETKILLTLSYCKSFKELQNLFLEPKWTPLIQNIFSEIFELKKS